MISSTDLPDDSAALAEMAVSEAETELRRNAAWQRLISIIQHIAEAAARACGCCDVEADAVGYVWQQMQRGRFDAAKGRFDSWCRVVLHHRALDLRRQSTRTLLGSTGLDSAKIEQIPDNRATPDDSATCLLAERLIHLREALDRLSGVLAPGPNGVHYFAVLLLQLRLALARRAAGADPAGSGRYSRSLESCLPWRPRETELCFRPGLPSLSEIWEHLRPLIDEPPHWITGSRLCEEMRRLPGGTADVTPEVWVQWVRRAKKALIRCLDQRTWSELFSSLLPDR